MAEETIMLGVLVLFRGNAPTARFAGLEFESYAISQAANRANPNA